MIKRLVLALTVVGSLCLMPASALAANQLCPANAPPAVLNSEVCKTEKDPIAGPGGLISKVTNIASVFAGIAAVVMIMIGGFKYITSTGESSKIQEAKKTLLWSVVGLVVIVLARTIILFVINRV